jgi:hypothetical protein
MIHNRDKVLLPFERPRLSEFGTFPNERLEFLFSNYIDIASNDMPSWLVVER